mgnify:CR=1 FL=1
MPSRCLSSIIPLSNSAKPAKIAAGATRARIAGITSVNPAAKTIPESVFMLYQMTFAAITVALVAGSVADRMRFSAFLWFIVGWVLLVYVPLAHMIWGGGFLTLGDKGGVLDFAGGLVVHLNAGIAGLVAAYVLGARRGYGSENLSPFDLSLAVIGTGLLWVGWMGFNGGSALAAGARAGHAIVATHLAACAGVMTWMLLEWWDRGKPSVLGMISGAVADRVNPSAEVTIGSQTLDVSFFTRPPGDWHFGRRNVRHQLATNAGDRFVWIIVQRGLNWFVWYVLAASALTFLWQGYEYFVK